MYKLIINTDSYTGNFERELISYCFGILQKSQETHSLDFQKAFWTKVAGTGISSYEDYKKINKEAKLNKFEYIINQTRFLLGELTEEEKQKKEKEFIKKELETDWTIFYNECLEYTYQYVDDIEEETFYNIENWDGNGCNSIIVQLKKPLPKYQENIIIPRIKNFFEKNIMQIITDYEYVCQFEKKSPCNYNMKLLDLLLVDEDGNILKNYNT